MENFVRSTFTKLITGCYNPFTTLQFQKQPATPVEGPLPMSHRVVDQKSEEKSKNTGFDDDDFDDFHNFDFSDFDANESK